VTRTVDWTHGRTLGTRGIRGTARLSARLAQARRNGSSRVRTPEDRAIITRMARVEIERRVAEGRLVRIGPREYEFHPRTAAPPPA